MWEKKTDIDEHDTSNEKNNNTKNSNQQGQKNDMRKRAANAIIIGK